MIYHLFQYLERTGLDFPGLGLMHYISFRAILASVTAVLIALIAGKGIIRVLQRKQIGETVRDLGLQGQIEKKGTPTMGGVIILLSILTGVLLFCDLTNIYVQLMLLSAVWCGALGFADDYIKVFRHNKEGLSEKKKLIGQIVLGFIIGIAVWQSKDIVVREKVRDESVQIVEQGDTRTVNTETLVTDSVYKEENVVKSTKTTIPFVKNHEFDYRWLSPFKGTWGWYAKWAIYVLMIVLVITACSNGTNLTDGLDGLAAGTSAIHVPPGHRRNRDLLLRLRRRADRLPLVQLLPGPGIHGRHRQPRHRRDHRRRRRPHPQGTPPAPALRDLLRREPVRAPAAGIFQIYQKEIRPGTADLEHDPDPPPLPGQEGTARTRNLPQAGSAAA